MTTSPADADTTATPNHHADHPGFSGVGGLFAALCFTVGRGAQADLAIELAGVGPDDDVVDVGCGPGVAVRRAAGVARSVVGVDPAPVMLRVARALGGPSRRYLQGAAEALPLPDDSATVVWSLATVHHWQDLDAGLREARRVLRPRGGCSPSSVASNRAPPVSPATAGPSTTPSASPSCAARPVSSTSRSAVTGRAGERSLPSVRP